MRQGESGSVSERVLTESERDRETFREGDGDSVSEDSERGALTAATRQHWAFGAAWVRKWKQQLGASVSTSGFSSFF